MPKAGWIIAGAIAATSLPAPAHADCRVLPFRFFRDVQTSTTMYVTAGRPCGVIVRAGGSSRFDSVSVGSPPRHGTLVARAGVGVTYRSQPSFKGEDSFVFAVTGTLAGGSGTASTRVNVIVE